jgi:hypothetical protein
LVILVLFMFWNSYSASTMEAVTIQKVSENNITVVNLNNRVRTIILAVDISNLLEVNKEYIISYEKKLFDKHRLKYISSQIP